MSDKPEPLAAILAEMRDLADHRAADAGGERPGIELLRSFADRIEAAAERERDEDRQLAAIAESDEAFARCARCDRPERVHGNAAALRVALERIRPLVRAAGVTPYVPERKELIDGALGIIDAALAAPARNCDRFQNWHDAMREEYFTRSTPENVKGYPYGDEKRWREFCDWLFATAEGGAR
jgi:hypothetical protein